MNHEETNTYNELNIIHSKLKILNELHKKSCSVVCENGGDILELGFGAGIDSDFIQSHNIKSHTILEIDGRFFEKLQQWAIDKPKVKPIKGDWLTHIPKGKKYDGIFLDLWDCCEEYQSDLHQIIKKHSKPGTIFVCATAPVFNKELFINDPDFTYEEIDPKIKLKWYHLLSRLIRCVQKKHNHILAYSSMIRKVTYIG
tara:strand:- start:603 stop:1199 length:597 start_codon:yes stop_codon:yes gene_type:complete